MFSAVLISLFGILYFVKTPCLQKLLVSFPSKNAFFGKFVVID